MHGYFWEMPTGLTISLIRPLKSIPKYKTLTKSADEIKYADQQIAACKIAIQFMNDPLDMRKTNLGSPVNTNSSNFKAVVSGRWKKAGVHE